MHLLTTLKYIKQKLTDLKGKTDDSAIIVRYFNNPFSKMDRKTINRGSSRETEDWNSTLKQPDLIDIYRTVQWTTTDYILLSVYEAFCKISHILGSETSQ